MFVVSLCIVSFSEWSLALSSHVPEFAHVAKCAILVPDVAQGISQVGKSYARITYALPFSHVHVRPSRANFHKWHGVDDSEPGQRRCARRCAPSVEGFGARSGWGEREKVLGGATASVSGDLHTRSQIFQLSWWRERIQTKSRYLGPRRCSPSMEPRPSVPPPSWNA